MLALFKAILIKVLHVFAFSVILTGVVSAFLLVFFLALPHGGMINAVIESSSIDLPAHHFEGIIRAKEVVLKPKHSSISMPVSFTADGKTYDVTDGYFNLIASTEPDDLPELRLTTENGYFKIKNDCCDSFQINGNEIILYLGVNADLEVKDDVVIWSPLNHFNVDIMNCPDAYIYNQSTKDKTPIQSFSSDEILVIKPANYTMATHVAVMSISIPGEKDISFSGIGQLENDGEGEVLLYKTATPQKIDYRGELKAKGDFTARLTDKFEISGYANELTIMRKSVFPGFLNWVNDNVYVIPSMLLTIIGGAIALTGQMKKDEKKTEKTYNVTVVEKTDEENK